MIGGCVGGSVGPCHITLNQMNLDQIEIIQFWTFLDILWTFSLKPDIPLQGYFLFSCSKASDANIGITGLAQLI